MKPYIILILLLIAAKLTAMDISIDDFSNAITNQQFTQATAILEGNPQIITKKPTESTDWVDLVLMHAENNSQNPTVANQYDDLAVRIVGHMMNFQHIPYKPDQSHLLIACKRNRYMVVHNLLNEKHYNIEFKGINDTQSPYEWAYIHNNELCARKILHYAQQQRDQQAYAAQHAQLQQQIAAQQQLRAQQYGVSPHLKQQFEDQQRAWNSLQARYNQRTSQSSSSHDEHIPLPKLNDTPQPGTPFWKKVLIGAVICYGCKKLWDWYFYEEPRETESDEPEDAWNTDNPAHIQ